MGVRVTPQCDTIESFPICNRTDAQFSPSIVYNGDNFLVTWTDRRYNGTNFWATAARVTPGGAVLDTGYCIGAQDAHDEFYPNTAFDGTRCLTVWFHSYYMPYGIFGRFVNGSAQAEDSVIMISSTLTYLYNYPKVEFGINEYLVVWADKRLNATDYDIYGHLISPQGQLIGDTITIASGTENQQRPDIIFNGQYYLVVWCETNYIYGRRISITGQLIGNAFLISDNTPNSRNTPRISAGNSNFCIVWSEQPGTFSDIYGNVDISTGISDSRQSDFPISGIPTIIKYAQLGRFINQEYSIYDISGKLVKQHDLNAGIYFIKKNNETLQKKLIIVR